MGDGLEVSSGVGDPIRDSTEIIWALGRIWKDPSEISAGGSDGEVWGVARGWDKVGRWGAWAGGPEVVWREGQRGERAFLFRGGGEPAAERKSGQI